jgi:hypothetical protein
MKALHDKWLSVAEDSAASQDPQRKDPYPLAPSPISAVSFLLVRTLLLHRGAHSNHLLRVSDGLGLIFQLSACVLCS